MRATALCVLPVLFAASCNDDSYVRVTVDGNQALTLTGFNVNVRNAGEMRPVTFNRSGALFSLPQSFVLALKHDRVGAVELDVRAVHGAEELGRVNTSVTIAQGGTVDVEVMIGDMVADLGIADSPASTDLTQSEGMGFDLLPPPLALKGQMKYPAGTQPTAVAVGDFDHDGRLDVAVSEGASESMGYASILLGNGNGSLRAPVSYLVGKSPEAIAAADVDGDGKIDLVTADLGSGTASVLIGRGDGTFQPAMSYAAGPNPQFVAVGLVDGDSKPDLAVVNQSNCEVDVLLGSGGGAFMAAKANSLAIGMNNGCFSIAVADLNKDGKADLVVGVSGGSLGGSGGVAVLLGKGDGSFLPAKLYASGGLGWTAAVGDANGDGRLDLLTANSDGSAGVVLGNGDGTFQPPTHYPAGDQATDIIVGDVSGDGRIDIVATVAGGASVCLMLGAGNGSFGPGQVVDTGAQPYGAAIGDLNGDNKPDLVTANHGSNDVSVLLNQ